MGTNSSCFEFLTMLAETVKSCSGRNKKYDVLEHTVYDYTALEVMNLGRMLNVYIAVKGLKEIFSGSLIYLKQK